MNKSTAGFHNTYLVECVRGGKKIWEESVDNLVVNEGLNHTLEVYFKGANYTAAHFVGLKGVGAIAAADTLTTKAWTEITGYTGSRKPLVFGAVVNQGVDNSASKATFNITASATIAGSFAATVATGTAGKLYSAVDFAQNRPVIAGDIIIVTCLFTQRSV